MRTHQVMASIVTLAFSASVAFAGGGTAMTYQGRLLDAGEPANGPFDLEFSLWDAAEDGNQVAICHFSGHDGDSVITGFGFGCLDNGGDVIIVARRACEKGHAARGNCERDNLGPVEESGTARGH